MGVFEVLLALGGVVALYFYNQVNAAGHLVFFPGSITGLSFEGSTPAIDATILIQNTSNVDFTFNSVAGNVYSDGILAGNASSFTPTPVPGNTEGTLHIKIRLLPLSIANDIISAITNGGIKRKLTLDGSVNANGSQVALALEFQIGI